MKLHFALILPLALLLFGCGGDDASSAYADLKEQTGATDEELKKGIELFTEFQTLMQGELGAGTLDAQTMIDSVKNSREVLDSISREDEKAAIMMLIALRTLEEGGADRAASMLVTQLQRFVDAKFPSTEQSEKIREKIMLYAEDSEAFKSRNSRSEQGAGDQAPAAVE